MYDNIEIDENIVSQEMKLKYLGIDITSYGKFEDEVLQQVLSEIKTARSLNDIIWRYKHFRQNTAIRPLMM